MQEKPFLLNLTVIAITVFLMTLFCIGVNAAPTYAPTTGKNPLVVHFTFPGGEKCDAVNWTFGEGNTSKGINTDHTYYGLGKYYPTCSCSLPGAIASYSYDYVYVIPWSSTIRDSQFGGSPSKSDVERSTEGLSPESLKKQAEGLAAIGHWSYAADAYTDLAKMTTLDSQTLTNFGDVLTGLGRFADAEIRYSEALEGNESTAVLNKLADVFFNQGKREKAIKTMNRSIFLAPDDAGAYATYATFLKKAGRNAEALDAYNQSFKLQDAQPGLWSDYANLLFTIGQLELAANAYEHAISLGDLGSDMWNSYAQVLMKLGRKDDPQRAKEKAMNALAPGIYLTSQSSSSIPSCGIGSMN